MQARTPQDAYEGYEGIDSKTRAALALSAEEIVSRTPIPIEPFDDNAAMIASLAQSIRDDLGSALEAGRDRALMIVPVGPVGQYELLARACLDNGLSLDRLTLIIMDEYLTMAGDWIPESDPLSFRRHVRMHLMEPLPEEKRPQVIVPDPHDLAAVGRTIESHGGVDTCFAGVGITGHLAFNDPLPDAADPDWFASLTTRIVTLLPETRLINSVTAARGNVSRIPHMAVTVGMAEILGARRLRIFMNREWQCAAIRRMLFGPVTGSFPASLVRRHPNASLNVVRHVLDSPEPGLR